MSVSVDWKPERAVQAKIRDKQKFTIILIGWNPKRAIYAKVKDHDKVTTSVRHDPLGASRYRKTSNLKHLRIKNLKQGPYASNRHDPLGASRYRKTSNSKHLQLKNSKKGQFKVVRENNGYRVQCTLPIYLPFPKIFKDPWSHAIRRLPLNSSNLSLCQFIWNSRLFYIQNFFYFLMTILEAKIFKIQKLFFTSFEKCEQQTHLLWIHE